MPARLSALIASVTARAHQVDDGCSEHETSVTRPAPTDVSVDVQYPDG
jgi:hypothetical protein